MRVSIKMVEDQIKSLNDLVGAVTPSGIPPLVGSYVLAGAYGGYALHRLVSDSGGVESIFPGYMPKKELYEKISIFKQGICFQKDIRG